MGPACIRKKDLPRAADAYTEAVRYARERALRHPGVVDDQLSFVRVLLGRERTAGIPLSGPSRTEAISILKRVDEQGKLPPDLLAELNRITRP